MIITVIIEFILFSFVGWIIDSGYRSIIEKRWINAGYFPGPFCPIYGVGGVVLVFIFKLMVGMPVYMQLIIGSIAMILVEYIGGIFSEKVLNVRLWDYSKTTFNIGGHIDLLHSFYWVLLVIKFYWVTFPLILIAESRIQIPEYLDIPALIVFLIIIIWITEKREPHRFLDIKDKVLNISVSDYKNLLSNMRKLSKAISKSRSAQAEELKAKIKSQLDKAGAKLKNFRI